MITAGEPYAEAEARAAGERHGSGGALQPPHGSGELSRQVAVPPPGVGVVQSAHGSVGAVLTHIRKS